MALIADTKPQKTHKLSLQPPERWLYPSIQRTIRKSTPEAGETTGAAGDEDRCWNVQASVNDQWNFLLKTIWDQMIHLVIRFDGRLDLPRVERAVRKALLAEPLATARCARGEPPCFEPACPDPGMPVFALIRTGDLDHALGKVLSVPLDPEKGPMARVRLLRSDSDLLCISFNHTITDAYGVKSFGSLIARLYRSGTGEEEYRPVGSSHDRSFNSIFSLFTPAECRAAAGRIRSWQGAGRIPYRSFRTGNPQYATHTIEKESFSRMRQYSRMHGITVNDLLLASYVLALAESTPVPEGACIPVLTSIDLRRYLSPGMYPPLANLSVAFELPVTITGLPDPGEVVLQVHDRMSESKSGHAGIGAAMCICREFAAGFLQVEKQLAEMEEKTRNGLLPKNPFFTNLGVMPESVVDYGVPVRSAGMLGPVEYPPGFGLAACTFRDRLTLSAGFSGDSLDRAWAGTLLSSVAHHLSCLTSRV